MSHSNENKIVMPFMLSARQPDRVESTTVVFQQPEDEIPRTRAPEAIQGKQLKKRCVLCQLNH